MKTHPLQLLPERSVEAVHCFFDGYSVFGGPLKDLDEFRIWVMKRLFYPQDAGATWWRCIRLNASDSYNSFQLFLELYFQFIRDIPAGNHEALPNTWRAAEDFDFYGLLYSISRKPGFWFSNGGEGQINLLSAYLSGYFIGKSAAGFGLNRDEREFLRFDAWLCRSHKFKKSVPSLRILELWPYGRTASVESFFNGFDAYLTQFGKKARGLEDLFKVVKGNGGTSIRRRETLPKKLVLLPESSRWWRHKQR